MNDRNFSAAYLPNSAALMIQLAGQPGFLAIANEDSNLEMVAIMGPPRDAEEWDRQLSASRIMAAAPQMLRALDEVAAMLQRLPSDAASIIEAEEWETKLVYLREYIDGKLGNSKEGGAIALPKFF